MKKVLYVATVDVHIRTFHLPYLKLLHDDGYEVHVATNGNEQFSYCDFKHQICIERNPFKFKNLKAIKQLQKIIDVEKFDIIHCHTPMGAVVTRLAARSARKKYGTRVIYTAHGFHFYKGAPIVNWMLFYPIEKWLAKYTDTLITINKEDYELANKKFSKRCHDIKYVPGVGIDTKKFDIKLSNKEMNELRKSLKIDENDYVLTCVARLDANKNQGFLIKVMDQLVKDNSNYHLLLVGPDELNGHYQKMVNNMNLNKNVHFLGKRENIPNILAITNVVVSASLREGLPVNVIEAFASGKPVVSLNCRGMSDLIVNGENGYVISENSQNNFVSTIEILHNNYKLAKKLSENNKKRSENYCLEKIIYDMSKIYYKKKRVLHVLATNKYSGAENVACTIIDNMSSEYEMAYCSIDGPIRETLSSRSIRFYGVSKLSIKNLNKVIKEFRPDVIHAHDFRASIISCVFNRKLRIISHIHKNDPAMIKISIKSLLYLFSSKKYSNIIGVSDTIYNEYIFKKSIKNKFVSIYNYVDKNRVLELSKEYIINETYDLFYLGRFSEEKNPLMFIEIVNSINDKKIKCIMIGDGPLINECNKMIKEYSLEKNISIVGFKKNPYPYIMSSNIGIMPSKWEGFGLTAIESLILNKPIINSGVGGLGEIFKNEPFYICHTIDEYVAKYNTLKNTKVEQKKFENMILKYTNKSEWILKIENLYN